MSISGSDSLAAEPGGYQGRRRPSEGLHAARFGTVSASGLEEKVRGMMRIQSRDGIFHLTHVLKCKRSFNMDADHKM